MTALDQWYKWLAIVGIVLLLLVYGRPFLVPLVVAFLIFTVLTAAIEQLSRIKLGSISLPYWLAAAFGLAAVGIGMFLVYSILSGEIQLIIAEWPTIMERLQSLIEVPIGVASVKTCRSRSA